MGKLLKHNGHTLTKGSIGVFGNQPGCVEIIVIIIPPFSLTLPPSPPPLEYVYPSAVKCGYCPLSLSFRMLRGITRKGKPKKDGALPIAPRVKDSDPLNTDQAGA